MAYSGIVICDTNIFIEFFKGNDFVTKQLKQIGQSGIGASMVTVGELFFGAFNKLELAKIKKNLNSVHVFHLNESISKLSLELLDRYSISHRLPIPDALIAATSIHYQVPIHTLNIKDFKFIKHLEIWKG